MDPDGTWNRCHEFLGRQREGWSVHRHFRCRRLAATDWSRELVDFAPKPCFFGGQEEPRRETMSFPNTSWTVLAQATLQGNEAGRRAMEEFCQLYWRPVYLAICASGRSGEDAEDQTQSFFRYLMANSTLRRAERGRGKFRTFLLTILWRFLRDERDKLMAEKRGGDATIFPLEESAEEELPAEAAPLTEALDREWAKALFERVIETIRAEVIAARSEEAWILLRQFLPGSLHTPLMAEVAPKLGLTEGGLRSEVHRLRQRCREVLRYEVVTSVSSPEEIDEEIIYLGRVLRIQWEGIVPDT
jgi:DNA-directed RNA polymerase specialized sigma24 family protein